jgi:hypothetical protein
MSPSSALGMMARGARQIGELASGERAPMRGGVRLLDAGPFDYAAHFRALSDEAVAVESAEAALRSYERAPSMGVVIGSALAFGFVAWTEHRASRRSSKRDRQVEDAPLRWAVRS